MFYLGGMSANPSRRDRWPPPTRVWHVWVRFGTAAYPPPYPGLVLEWRHRQALGQWEARVMWLEDDRGPGRRTVKQGWVAAEHLRPARSDWNVWE